MDDQQAREAAAKAMFDALNNLPADNWAEEDAEQRDYWATGSNAAIDAYLAALPVAPEQPAQANDTLAAAIERLSRLRDYVSSQNSGRILTPELLAERNWGTAELSLLMETVGLGFIPDTRDALLLMKAYAALVSSPSMETVTPDKETIVREVIDWYERQGASKPFDLTQRDAREHFGVSS